MFMALGSCKFSDSRAVSIEKIKAMSKFGATLDEMGVVIEQVLGNPDTNGVFT